MAGNASGASAATRVFLWLALAAAATTALIAVLLVVDAQQAENAEAETVTRAIAETIAAAPATGEALASGDATPRLQPVADEVAAQAGVDFVTVMTTAGVRVTHPDAERIGEQYLGTIPSAPRPLTERFTGTLGPSVRTIVPIEHDGAQVGWVAVGVTVNSILDAVVDRIPAALSIAAAVLVAGLVGAWVARRTTRRVAGDLPAARIRETLASYESMRTLGEALRAQTHEHGNRMHTAVALLELGRTQDAVDILAETSRRSQELVDQVAARTEGDPTVGALLLGKAAQAAERGIRWEADIAADAPRSLLSPVDQVALVGNLIDNALDAAASGPAPRWIRIVMARTDEDELRIDVSDSGDGVAPHLQARIFERGFSTKPADAAGRGLGLALVRSVVEDVGGTIAIDDDRPTTFRVILPTGDTT